MSLPPLNKHGDLPLGVHRATLQETIERFGKGSTKRQALSLRLERIHHLATNTAQLSRFVVFGSFITAKPEPNDVDVFMIMENSFDVGQLTGELRLLFDHTVAQNHFGGSVFWVRKLAALGGEQTAIEHWQIKRDGNQRGIVEIISEAP
jgi:hypothetical protein